MLLTHTHTHSSLSFSLSCHPRRLDTNEEEIAKLGALPLVLAAAKSNDPELQNQGARALRNLTVNAKNKELVKALDGVALLNTLSSSSNERVRQQSLRALANLSQAPKEPAAEAEEK